MKPLDADLLRLYAWNSSRASLYMSFIIHCLPEFSVHFVSELAP